LFEADREIGLDENYPVVHSLLPIGPAFLFCILKIAVIFFPIQDGVGAKQSGLRFAQILHWRHVESEKHSTADYSTEAQKGRWLGGWCFHTIQGYSQRARTGQVS
jgi:hypothetical protein